MAYLVEFLRSAEKQLAKLPKRDRVRVARAIDALENEPRPRDSKLLQGQGDRYYRIRVGSYRVIYRVEDDRLVVLVVRLGHRGDIYR